MGGLHEPSTEDGAEEESEPSLTLYGKTITESEFLRARRANMLRWVISMAVGIPVFLIIVVFLGFWIGLVAAGFALPAVFALVTKILPSSKRHGTALYRKYIDHRKMLQYRQKNP